MAKAARTKVNDDLDDKKDSAGQPPAEKAVAEETFDHAEEKTEAVTTTGGLDETGAKTSIAVGITEIKHEPVAADASLPAVANGDVMMTFPKPVNVIDRGIMHKFAVGRHAVPAALVKHWYLAANGVELVK